MSEAQMPAAPVPANPHPPAQSQTPALTGSLHHISLSVSNMQKSIVFYKYFCEQILGYQELHITDEHAMWWKYNAGAIGISPGTNITHNKFNPGFHHLGLNMESRQEVDLAYRKIQAFYNANQGQDFGRILDEPAEYPYMTGYYAVFFTDPDGMKLELVHTPASSYDQECEIVA